MTKTGPMLPGDGKTDYERYLRVTELLSLQKSLEQIVNPDEPLFQTTHQTAELWLKQIDFEMSRAVSAIRAGELGLATDLLERSTRVLDLLRQQIVILEMMTPADYHVIRTRALGRGSGQESPGFNRLLDVGDRLWPAVEAALAEVDLKPLDILRAPRENESLNRLIQALLNYDGAFMKWRYTHMRLAMRIIGSRVKSLKGVPVTQLEAGTREPLFPLLWDAISDLTDETRPEY